MEIITSKNNHKIVFAQKLKQKKYRDEFSLALIESDKVIQEAVNSNIKIKQLFCSKDKLDKAPNIACDELYQIDDSLCKLLSSTVTSQNMFAVIEIPQAKNICLGKRVLVLDNLQNPDNMGAILRTSMATDFKDIVLINCVDVYNEKVIRSSMGNVFKANFIKTDYQSINNVLQGYQICVADMFGEDVFNVRNFAQKVALVIGNEGNGVSENLRKICTKVVSIPMQNNVESLNASVSAGIIMYQIKNNQGE